MCLSDRVLVYGDCAVNPDPTAPQLADIAISSAATADAIRHRPAGGACCRTRPAPPVSGADVDKVRAATELVHELRPDLLVGGADPVRRGGRPAGGVDQVARLPGRREGHRVDLPGPEHRQQHLQGRAAQCQRDRDRAGAAGTEQAGERPVPWCAGRRHREHRRHHRRPGAGRAGRGSDRRRQLRAAEGVVA